MKSYEKNHGKKESILYFSTLRKVKVLVAQSCLFVTPWTIACQAPLIYGILQFTKWNTSFFQPFFKVTSAV